MARPDERAENTAVTRRFSPLSKEEFFFSLFHDQGGANLFSL